MTEVDDENLKEEEEEKEEKAVKRDEKGRIIIAENVPIIINATIGAE